MLKKNCLTIILIICSSIIISHANEMTLGVGQVLDSSTCILPSISENKFTARFVRLSAPGAINISQIVCFDDIGFNVTYQKPVTASSVYDNTIKLNAATDGSNFARPYPNIFHSALTNNNQLTIDLGRDFVIKKCIIYNRTDCCQDRMLNSKLELLDSNRNLVASSVIDKADLEIKVLFPNHRYIYLKASGEENHALQVSQIACYDKTGTNIALGKPVSASSVLPGTDPKVVTDGNMNIRSHPQAFHCNEDSGCDLTIDLQAAYEVVKCKYYNRADCCKERILKAKLDVINLERKAVKSYIFNDSADVVDIDMKANVRYIKLKAASSGDKWFNFSQLACYDDAGNFVTKGKPVTASSIMDNSYDPNTITDGTLAVREVPKAFHCGAQNNCEISIDLGSSYKISKCVFYNRQACCQARIIGAKLSLHDFDNNELKSFVFAKGDNVMEIDLR